MNKARRLKEKGQIVEVSKGQKVKEANI